MLLAGSAAALLPLPTKSRAEDIIRIATLASGTVAWEIDTILHHGLDRKFGFTLSVVPVAGKQSADVMLAAGACDVIDGLDLGVTTTPARCGLHLHSLFKANWCVAHKTEFINQDSCGP